MQGKEEEMSGSICGVSRGRYIKPILFIKSGIKFVDEDYIPTETTEEFCACEHIKHWSWGKGTRNGQKLYYPTNEMYYQKWHMTRKELNEAINQFDIFSLEMTGRIICPDCAKKEIENLKLKK